MDGSLHKVLKLKIVCLFSPAAFEQSSSFEADEEFRNPVNLHCVEKLWKSIITPVVNVAIVIETSEY